MALRSIREILGHWFGLFAGDGPQKADYRLPHAGINKISTVRCLSKDLSEGLLVGHEINILERESTFSPVDSRLSAPTSCIDEGAGEWSRLRFERSVIPAA